MKKIAVVTATRAEYGILRPLICRLQKDTEFELQLIVKVCYNVKCKEYTQTAADEKSVAFAFNDRLCRSFFYAQKQFVHCYLSEK